MPFTIRPPIHRFPVYCPVIYHASLFEGRDSVWNLCWSIGSNINGAGWTISPNGHYCLMEWTWTRN